MEFPPKEDKYISILCSTMAAEDLEWCKVYCNNISLYQIYTEHQVCIPKKRIFFTCCHWPSNVLPVNIKTWPSLCQQISSDIIAPNRFNTLRPRQKARHFADDILKCIFLNENAQILLKISLKFVPRFQINNIPA